VRFKEIATVIKRSYLYGFYPQAGPTGTRANLALNFYEPYLSSLFHKYLFSNGQQYPARFFSG
jgi:hypothetical protein